MTSVDSERTALSDEREREVSPTTAQRVPFPSSLWNWLRSWWTDQGPAGLTPTVRIQILVEWEVNGPFKVFDVRSPAVPAQGEWIKVEGLDVHVVDRAWSGAEGKLSVLLRTRAQVSP